MRHVLFGQNGERFAPPERALIIARTRGADEDQALFVEHGAPAVRQPRRVPGRHEDNQSIALRWLARGNIESKTLLCEIDRFQYCYLRCYDEWLSDLRTVLLVFLSSAM